jgi:hypothetical protein
VPFRGVGRPYPCHQLGRKRSVQRRSAFHAKRQPAGGRFHPPRLAPGATALRRRGPSGPVRTDVRLRPNAGVHVGLALARIQLIGEQAILKRGSPGAPRLTALGLDREAARRARQRVSAEIVALPVSCSSSSEGVAAAIGVKQQRVCGPARPCHRPGQSTTLTIASTVVTSPSARAQWRRDPCPPRASQRDCIGIASARTALSGSLAMGGDHCVESPARVVARVADDRRLFGRRL